jgi:type IV pilus assembly protein PilV
MPTDNQKNHFCSRNNGFTLIEVLIAMAIFSIGILAVASMQLWNVKNNTTGNITTLATLLARDQMEQLKNVADVTTLASGTDPNNPVDENGNAGGIFTRSWVVTNPLGGSATRQIQVTVSWTKGGPNRSVVLTSITRGNGT